MFWGSEERHLGQTEIYTVSLFLCTVSKRMTFHSLSSAPLSPTRMGSSCNHHTLDTANPHQDDHGIYRDSIGLAWSCFSMDSFE